MKRLLVGFAIAVAAVIMSGCKQDIAEAASAPPKNYIVLLDRSLSRSDASREDGTQFINRLSKGLNFGDHIAVLQVQELGLNDHPKHWSDDMPSQTDPTFVSSYDRKMLEAEQENVQSAVKSLSSVSDGAQLVHTDLFTTLGLAGEYKQDYGGRLTTLIVLSDMLQSAKGIEMDHAKQMPPPGWISQQRQLGLLPNFTGACVLVVGADGVTSSGVKVRDFWRNYFTATGANLPVSNYRARPPLTDQVCCPSAFAAGDPRANSQPAS
jgi:hypothetical protein